MARPGDAKGNAMAGERTNLSPEVQRRVSHGFLTPI
jgi:hypothetical protein